MEVADNLACVRKYLKSNSVQQMNEIKKSEKNPKGAGRNDEAGSIRQIYDWLNMKGEVMIILALDVLPMLEEEARKRQKGGQGGILLREKVPEASKGRASEAAGKIMQVNERYVRVVKKLKEQHS